MSERKTFGCEKCAEHIKRIDELEAELAKARKNSTNSSKPPSSDIVTPKPKRPKGKGKRRKRGAQKGHPKHERADFAEDQVDHFWDYTVSCCPDCGGPIEVLDKPAEISQQIELTATPVIISEHRAMTCRCRHCHTEHHAPFPGEISNAGLFGPKLTTLVAYLKGACHCSFSTIRKFVRDVLGVTVSRGYLAKLIRKASASLEQAYQQLLDVLPNESRLNIDETGHKEYSKRMWTWCFRASLFCLFKISPSRGSGVLIDVLGEEFDGVIGCDYFSAYRKYMKDYGVLVQFCLAHFIRDVKFLVEHPDKRNRDYGRRVREAAREMFALISRRDEFDEASFASELEDAGNHLAGSVISRVPLTREAENLAARFEKHGESYLRFITTPGVEPTNNLAEQAIRFCVIDRRITQGSRSEAGQRWLERIWTVIASCAQQGRSVFEFLHESIHAHFENRPPPHLVPNTS